jgi:hypothetical protein
MVIVLKSGAKVKKNEKKLAGLKKSCTFAAANASLAQLVRASDC